MKCPVCKGKGKLNDPKSSFDRKKATKILRDNGFSLRDIMTLLGYKSPRSVTKNLEDLNENAN